MEEIIKLKKELAELRLKIARSVKVISIELENMLNVFNKDDGNAMVTWNDLLLSRMGEKYYVNEKVYFTKYYQSESVQKFKCFMEAGGTFGMQEHDCLEEATVIKGHLIDYFKGGKIYTEGNLITYKPNELHKPYANVASIYDVVFTKKNEK